MIEEDPLEIVRGSGNVFADFNRPSSEALHLKAVLAGLITETLDVKSLTVRKAEECTEIAAADFSRIRKLKLDRFTIDRLMAILERLDGTRKVSVQVHMEPREATELEKSQ